MSMTITNNDSGGVVLADAVYADEILALAGADTIAKGTILARRNVATAIVAAEDESITGNGTCTLAAVVAGSEVPLVGAYNLECISADSDAGTAVGAAVKTGTGNGTCSAVVCGSKVIPGAYLVTCTDATVSGSEVFSVVAPDGSRLKDLTVGVAYVSNHISLTLTDGSTDFIAGDYWTVTVSSPGSKWKLEDPNGSLKANDLVMAAGAAQGTAFEVAGMTFTLTDGTTDFAVGDKFSLTVSADSDLVPFATDGVGGASIPCAVLPYEVVVTTASDVAIRAIIGGKVKKEKLIIDADADGDDITAYQIEKLRSFGILALETAELNDYDTQD